jgi:hypothetical protein
MGIKTLSFQQKIYLTNIKLSKEDIKLFKDIDLIQYEKNANNFFDNADKDKKSDIYNIIQEPIEEILKGHSFLLTEWWLQKYKKGNYHELHTHGADPFRRSFILYINCTKDSSPVNFFGPGHPLIYSDPIQVKPEPGLLILFPSYLPHEVLPNNDDKRLILSGNIEIQ